MTDIIMRSLMNIIKEAETANDFELQDKTKPWSTKDKNFYIINLKRSGPIITGVTDKDRQMTQAIVGSNFFNDETEITKARRTASDKGYVFKMQE